MSSGPFRHRLRGRRCSKRHALADADDLPPTFASRRRSRSGCAQGQYNLYYGALKGTPHKWLDVKALFGAILRPENQILRIKYYTARVSARPDNPDAPTRQDFYLQALEAHIPELEITFGHFIQKPVTMRLVHKMRFRTSMYVRCSNPKRRDPTSTCPCISSTTRGTTAMTAPSPARMMATWRRRCA